MATKKKSSKFGQKAAFVRSTPRDTPAKDVVALAKKKGIVLTEGYVYTIRSSGSAKAKAAIKPGNKKGRPSIGSMTPAESQLRDAIADLGLVAATRILESVKATFKGH
jgi:hypothetical protein